MACPGSLLNMTQKTSTFNPIAYGILRLSQLRGGGGGGGRGFLSHTPENNDYLIDLKFGTDN